MDAKDYKTLAIIFGVIGALVLVSIFYFPITGAEFNSENITLMIVIFIIGAVFLVLMGVCYKKYEKG